MWVIKQEVVGVQAKECRGAAGRWERPSEAWHRLHTNWGSGLLKYGMRNEAQGGQGRRVQDVCHVENCASSHRKKPGHQHQEEDGEDQLGTAGPGGHTVIEWDGASHCGTRRV